MEVNRKLKTCPNGHPYDPIRYKSCPVCSSGGFVPTLDPFDDMLVNGNPNRGKTMSPENYPVQGETRDPGNYSNQKETIDPQSIHVGGPGSFNTTRPPEDTAHTSGRMSATMTVDDLDNVSDISPVVGWLVITNGTERGKDYPIHSGYNYIGRTNGDIRISSDPTISATRDSSITYVSQTRGFYIAHEQGKNPLLLNGRPIIRDAEVQSYDRITIGRTQLIFIALSGEKFDWSEG